MAISFTLFFTWPYALSLRFKQAEFVREGEMLTNSNVISWNVKTNGKCILTVGLPLHFIVCLKLCKAGTQRALREYPSENHAVLKYGSTSTLLDFVPILCRVTLQGGDEVGRI